VPHLAGLKQLQSLDMSRCGHLGLAGLQAVSLLTGLTQLRARGLKNRGAAAGGDAGWRGWAQLRELQVRVMWGGAALSCGACPLDAPCDQLGLCYSSTPTLPQHLAFPQALDLSGYGHPQGLPPALVAAIAQLPALRQLDLHGSLLAPGLHLRLLAGMSQLQDLSLDSWQLLANGQGLGELASLTALTRLHLLPEARLARQQGVQQEAQQGQEAEQEGGEQPQSQSQPQESDTESCAGAVAVISLPGSPGGTSSCEGPAAGQQGQQEQQEAREQCLQALQDLHLPPGSRVPTCSGASSSSSSSSSRSSSSSNARHQEQQGCSALDPFNASLAELGSSLLQLQDLSLPGQQQLTDAGLQQLGGLTRLTSLDLSGCRGLTGTGLASLAAATGLQRLCLRDCACVDDAGAAAVGQLTALAHLDLASCRLLSDQGLQAVVGGLRRLERLSVWGLRRLSAQGLQGLRSCRLRSLDASYCQGLGDEALEVLAGLPGLKELQLVCCWRVTDAGLAALQHGSEGRRLRVCANGCPWLSASWFKAASGTGCLQVAR
jgi:hypothetical protein